MVRPQKLSESDRVAFHGSLFAMAAVDGHVKQRELEGSAAEDQDSLRALQTLTRRLRTLQQTAHARKLEMEGPPTRRAASSAP